jgi:hypothetical protein
MCALTDAQFQILSCDVINCALKKWGWGRRGIIKEISGDVSL